MIKALAFIHKKNDFSDNDFKDYYEKNHAPLATSLLTFEGYERNYISTEINPLYSSLGSISIFQYQSIESLKIIEEKMSSNEGDILREDELKFMNVKKNSFYVNGHFPDNPVMPGVLIVEAFGQAAAALTAHGIDKKEYENKLVYLMSVDKARFRSPVMPDCELHLDIEAIRSHGRVWKYKGVAKIDGKKVADAEWAATIVERNK